MPNEADSKGMQGDGKENKIKVHCKSENILLWMNSILLTVQYYVGKIFSYFLLL